jgi:hypothetical protein
MKNKLLYAAMIGLLCLLVGQSLTTFVPKNTGKFAESGVLTDTITSTEKDSLYPGFTLTSNWQYSVHVTLTTLSGTRAMKIYLDESNVKAGNTDWVAVDSITPTATINQYVMDGAQVYGRRQRIRVSGNTGSTQSVKYDVSAIYKRTGP